MNLLKNKIFLYGYGILIVFNVYKINDEFIKYIHKHKRNLTIMEYNVNVIIGTFVGICFGILSPITYTFKTIKYLENKIKNK